MKKFIFLVLFFSYATNFYCQNLTLDELISLRKSDVAQVEEFVSKKDWTFLSANVRQHNEMASATFTYNKSTKNDLAESFLTYAYSDTTNRLNLQFANKDQYNSYVNRLKILGYDFIVSKIQNDAIVKLYLGKGLTIELTVSSKNENNITRTTYNLLITSSNDYLISFVDK